MKYEEEKKLIHSLSNSLFVADASLGRVLKILSDSNPKEGEELVRLTKASDAVKKSIETLQELRSLIHEKSRDG